MLRHLQFSLLAALSSTLLSVPLGAQPTPNLDNQACAVFTRAGVSLLATVSTVEVSLKIGTSTEASVLKLPSSIAPVATRATGNNICVVVLNASEDEAAIDIPLTPEAESPMAAVEVARFDLTTRAWRNPVTIAPPPPLANLLSGRYRNGMRLLGYRDNSSDLVLATSDQRLTLLTPDGRQSPAPANIPPSFLGTPSSISASYNRFWSSCDLGTTVFGRAEPCSLSATTLFGDRISEPKVLSPLLKPQPHVSQWAKPEFYADLGQTLVFASYPISGLHSAYNLWMANLNDGSIRQFAVPARFNDAALTGQFAVSPDKAVIAFSIYRSRLVCCVVDNYVPEGDRIVLIDLARQKVLADIRPLDRKSALAFAVNHASSKTTLLVDWGSGWQVEELPKE